MKILDAGHKYLLRTLDGEVEVVLPFVKREGEKYPGNIGHYPGTTIQEVLRACIDRLKYVNKQIPDKANTTVILLLRMAIHALERRAFRRHNIKEDLQIHEIELLPVNSHGHLWPEENHDK